MKFISTRGGERDGVSAAYAIKTGLAADGGLYMPESIPTVDEDELYAIGELDYPERAAAIIGKFLTDFEYEEIYEDALAAYGERFKPCPAPVRHLDGKIYMLELWHGPTSAFKDLALQLMPRLFVRALRKCGEEREALILVATSGDTGKAALEGYKNVPGTRVHVFYPLDGVSEIQKRQMQTQTGGNLTVTAIRGNFDDAQTEVKRIFSDPDVRARLNERGVFLSSANSINFGRLVPQIVYYFSAYLDMVKSGDIGFGEVIDVCVPTGNFGNIFAALIAKRMGLPLGTLVCASNRNDVLTEFLNTGVYNGKRPFYMTTSPSMDILISSNLERLLYLALSAEKTAKYMASLNECGRYALTEDDLAAIRADFVGYAASEEETASALRDVYENKNCLIDTHTAVAIHAVNCYMTDGKAERKMLTVSTASPYKFAKDVLNALDSNKDIDGLEALQALKLETATEIPSPLSNLDRKTVRFKTIIEKDMMLDAALEFAAN